MVKNVKVKKVNGKKFDIFTITQFTDYIFFHYTFKPLS